MSPFSWEALFVLGGGVHVTHVTHVASPPFQRMCLLDVQDIEPNRRNSPCVYIFAYNVDFDVNETNSLPFTIDETYFH